ncbi:MAG: DUF2069 domain-containing protein [Rhodocyclaceae bacterium]
MNRESRLGALELAASANLIALILLCLAWELWLAPLRPVGSMLVLKALPLLMPLFGILKGRRYTYQWSTFLALAYLAEGLVRATSDSGLSAVLAAAETLLATSFLICCMVYARLSAASRQT